MNAAEMFTAIGRVALLALIFGAGLPTLFALGMRAMTGDPIYDADGNLVDDTEASTAEKWLGYTVYAVLAVLVLVAIVFVARESIAHYFGWKPFGDIKG